MDYLNSEFKPTAECVSAVAKYIRDNNVRCMKIVSCVESVTSTSTINIPNPKKADVESMLKPLGEAASLSLLDRVAKMMKQIPNRVTLQALANDSWKVIAKFNDPKPDETIQSGLKLMLS